MKIQSDCTQACHKYSILDILGIPQHGPLRVTSDLTKFLVRFASSPRLAVILRLDDILSLDIILLLWLIPRISLGTLEALLLARVQRLLELPQAVPDSLLGKTKLISHFGKVGLGRANVSMIRSS